MENEERIREICREVIKEVGLDRRDSLEITKNAKGEYQHNVKLYTDLSKSAEDVDKLEAIVDRIETKIKELNAH